jgi:anion-transporting  ArsA/GET3 family ATPase
MARIPVVGRIGPLAHMFDFVADAAPGVKEILAIGKLCFEVREGHYDLVVVDAEASGHIVAQIDAPRAIRELVQVGPVREQTEWMLQILADHERTGLVVVTTPEEMPVTESIELVDKVRTTTDVDVAGVIVNRMLPEWFAARDRKVFDGLCRPAAQELLAAAAGPRTAVVLEAATLAQSRHDVAEHYVARLRKELPAGVPLHVVPELFTKASGRRVVALVADELQRVLG